MCIQVLRTKKVLKSYKNFRTVDWPLLIHFFKYKHGHYTHNVSDRPTEWVIYYIHWYSLWEITPQCGSGRLTKVIAERGFTVLILYIDEMIVCVKIVKIANGKSLAVFFPQFYYLHMRIASCCGNKCG